MTADKRKRLNSVRYVNSPISKPSCDREKIIQVGRSMTVSRARSTFCQFCNVRHSTFACPLINIENCWFRSYIQGESTMGLLQITQFWEDLRICLVIRKDRELSSDAAMVTISDWSPSLEGWNLERHDDILWLSGRMKMTILTIFIPMCDWMFGKTKW
jgi:hypothetical protein